MEIFFADDSVQDGRRGGMGKLIAIGGLLVQEESLIVLRVKVDELCREAGIPDGTELKWSPDKDNWIHDNLKGEDRFRLYRDSIQAAREVGARVVVVVWDSGRTTLKGAASLRKSFDYLFERVNMQLEDRKSLGLVVCDRPGGGKKEEDQLLADLVDTFTKGTEYVKATHVASNLLTTPSHLSRHIQLADLVVGCTTAMVAANLRYAEPLCQEILPMFCKNANDTAGGTGLKLFPDLELCNLFFYVLGEDVFWKVGMNSGWGLPWRQFPYYYDGFDQSRRTDERGDRES